MPRERKDLKSLQNTLDKIKNPPQNFSSNEGNRSKIGVLVDDKEGKKAYSKVGTLDGWRLSMGTKTDGTVDYFKSNASGKFKISKAEYDKLHN